MYGMRVCGSPCGRRSGGDHIAADTALGCGPGEGLGAWVGAATSGAHRGRCAGRQPTLCGRQSCALPVARVRRLQLAVESRLGKDHAASGNGHGTAPARARAAGRRDRGRSADFDRRRAHPRRRRTGDSDQHWKGLSPGRTHGGRGLRAAALACAWPRPCIGARSRPRPRAGRAGLHRERRQPGLPGALGSGRGSQGGDPVGHGGRRQATEVP